MNEIAVSVLNTVVPCMACIGGEGISPHRGTFRLEWRAEPRGSILVRTACERTLADEITRIASNTRPTVKP